MRIQIVELYFPNAKDGAIITYEVNKNCSEIKEKYDVHNRKYFEIYQNGNLSTELYHFSLIHYFSDKT